MNELQKDKHNMTREEVQEEIEDALHEARNIIGDGLDDAKSTLDKAWKHAALIADTELLRRIETKLSRLDDLKLQFSNRF